VPPPARGGCLGRWARNAIGDTGGIGSSTNMPDQAAAEQAANSRCVGQGGTNCRIQISYMNQCGVVVWGSDYFATARGPTIRDATKVATKLCKKETDGCKLYFSVCSYPRRSN